MQVALPYGRQWNYFSSICTSGSDIQSSVNSTSNNPTSISGSSLFISLSSVSTAGTAASLMKSGSASTSPSPTASSNGGSGGLQPTTITSAPSSTNTTFVFGSSVECAVSSATAAVDDATDQINQLQIKQNDQNIKQSVLSLNNQANTVAHTRGIGWLFGILGTAASEADAVVKGTAPVVDLVNSWENVEKAESEYSSSSSESSESSSQSEQSQRCKSTQSGTITNANPSSENPRTVSSTTMSSSSMSSSSTVSSSGSSCASGCTLSQVTLASVALDPSMSENLAAISSVELMASSWDNPSAWGSRVILPRPVEVVACHPPLAPRRTLQLQPPHQSLRRLRTARLVPHLPVLPRSPLPHPTLWPMELHDLIQHPGVIMDSVAPSTPSSHLRAVL